MANSSDDDFGLHLQEQAKAGEKEEPRDCREDSRATVVGGNGLVRRVDWWDRLSSQEIPEEVGLLEELKAHQDLLVGGSQSFDFCEHLSFEHAGKDSLGSLPPEDGELLEPDGSQEDLSPVSYWHPHTDQQLGLTEDEQDRTSSEEAEKQEGAWEAGSEGEAYPKLSYEGQYGSEFSASPEALRDPLLLYRLNKSASFNSDDGDALSEHTDCSPFPSRVPAEHPHMRIDVFQTQSLLAERLEYPEETDVSSPSRRSPGSFMLCSSAESAYWSRSLLERLSIEDLRNSPGIDSETFPESAYMENPGGPEGATVKMASSDVARGTQCGHMITVKPEERLRVRTRAMEAPHIQRNIGNQQPQRSRKLKADVPQGLPSKFSRQSRSLSPEGRAVQKKTERSKLSKSGPVRPLTPVTSSGLLYGRGQLNYPLPDLSKVEPRVRFPKDHQRYHPPQGKISPARSQGSGKPLIFKSPAEIVREVLLSSGEGSPQQCPVPVPASVIPEEFKSPKQATELVWRLQEDYHRLLTKYAEAENTIDRLRLGAKVSLYADLPKPSHSVEMGTISKGSKVMTFSIPQIRAAEVTGTALDASWNQGFSGLQATTSLPDSRVTGVPQDNDNTSVEKPLSGDHLTQMLAVQAEMFQIQVESLEELIQTGRLTPQDQLKGFARLQKAQAALEEAYLQAREECRQLQGHQEAAGTVGDFDSDRVVEGEIFHLEKRLEELKETIEQAAQNQPGQQRCSDTPTFPAQAPTAPMGSPAPSVQAPMGSPAPSVQAPIPVVRTPYPEVPVPKGSHYRAQVDVEVSSASEEEGVPETLWHKQLQVEESFDNLLDHYSSFKSLPEALSREQLHPEGQHLLPEAVNGAAGGDAKTKDDACKLVSEISETTCFSSLPEPQEKQPPELLPERPRQPLQWAQVEQAGTHGRSAETSSPSAAVPKTSSRRQQLSPPSSTASVAGSAIADHLAEKPFWKANTAAVPEDLRIVSPETDSGFVGSETNRVSPLAQRPNYRSSRSHDVVGESTLAMAATASPVQSASPRKEPSTVESRVIVASPRHTPLEGRAQTDSLPKRSPSQTSTLHRRASSVASESEPGTHSSHTNSEAEECDRPRANGACSKKTRHSRSSSATSVFSARTHCYDLLDSCLERDHAIVALQHEVLQLRQSLEETLRQSSNDRKLPSSLHASRIQAPFQGQSSFPESASTMGKTWGKAPGESRDASPVIKPEEWTRRLLLPQEGTRRHRSPSESDCPPPKSQEGKPQEATSSRTKLLKQHPIVQGPYTGTPYSFSPLNSQEPKANLGSISCSCRQEARSQPGEEPRSAPVARASKDPSRNPFRPSQRKAAADHVHKGIRNPSSTIVHEVDHGSKNGSPQSSSTQQKPGKQQLQPPGLWYLAVPSPATCISSVPPTVALAPCHLPAVIYYSPLAPTSTTLPAGVPVYDCRGDQARKLKTWAQQQQAPRGHHCSLRVDLDHLQELNWSVNRAMEVARVMKLTTTGMKQSLTAELSKVRSLRRSCLF